MKLENQEFENEKQTDITLQPPASNNNNWKEVQLRISENGEMSITGIQDNINSESFSEELIEVLDTKPKSPIMSSSSNSVKKKDPSELKIVQKPTQSSKCINIISDTIIRPFSVDTISNDCFISKGICLAEKSINSTAAAANFNKSKVETAESVLDNKKECKEIVEIKKETQQASENQLAKGIKRKFDDITCEESKIQKTSNNNSKKCSLEEVDSTINVQKQEVKNDKEKPGSVVNETKSMNKPQSIETLDKKNNCVETVEKTKIQNDDISKTKPQLPTKEPSINTNSNNHTKQWRMWTKVLSVRIQHHRNLRRSIRGIRSLAICRRRLSIRC